MKKFLAFALAVLLVALSLSCIGCDTKKENVLTVYTEAGFPPYEFIYHNQLVGVDIAIMEKVAEKMGAKLEITDVDFNTIVGAVQSGKVDCGAAGITISDERKESVDFSIPYSSTEQYVLVSAENTAIHSLEDMKGKQIGVQNGTTSDLLIGNLISDGTLSDATLIPYNTPALAAAALDKIDAVVTDKLTAQIITKNNAKVKAFPLVHADGSTVCDVEEYGICVQKGNSELLAVINEVLTEIMNDGTLDAWIEQYSAMASESDG